MNIAESFQLGVDVATAASVIGAVGLFIKNLRTENKKQAANRLAQLKIEQSIKVIDELLNLQNEGLAIANNLVKQTSNISLDNEKVDHDTIIDFCVKFHSFLNYNSIVLLTPVASKDEIEILNNLKDKVEQWNSNYVEYIYENDNLPRFIDLINMINEDLIKFMNCIKEV